MSGAHELRQFSLGQRAEWMPVRLADCRGRIGSGIGIGIGLSAPGPARVQGSDPYGRHAACRKSASGSLELICGIVRAGMTAPSARHHQHKRPRLAAGTRQDGAALPQVPVR